MRYEVVRVWTLPVQQLLAGGIGTLALAPISNVAEGEGRGVLRRIKERLSAAKAPRRAADVWAATYVLLGLRYSDEFADTLFQEVLGMEQSTTYQAIVRKGRIEEARRFLVLVGETRFGSPDEVARATIENLTDVAQLEDLGARLMSAGSWEELLAPPSRRRRRRREGQ